jgi:hypothetical protein
MAVESVVSIALLVYMLHIKENLTPDFLHFVVSLGEDTTHKLWILALWFTYKCFLSVGTTD